MSALLQRLSFIGPLVPNSCQRSQACLFSTLYNGAVRCVQALLLALTAGLSAPASASFHLVVQRHVLANGLVVILLEDHKIPKVTSYVWYKVGSANEPEGKSGFAHLFEHFMFEGSQNVPSGTVLKLTEKGCYANASTSYDRTDYIMSCPSNMLEEMLRLESDRMGLLEPAMTPENFEKQRNIVLNEKRQRDNKPYSEFGKVIYHGGYPAGHPYANAPIGSEQDLNAANVDDAKRFHAQFYWPNNAVLVISGDFNPETILSLVNKWYGNFKSGTVPPPPADLPGPPSLRRQDLTDLRIALPSLTMVWRIPGDGKPGSEELYILAALLAGGRLSPLVNNLTIKKKILLDISAEASSKQYGGLFTVAATPAPGVSLQAAEKAIEYEMGRALSRKPDVRRIKAFIEYAETSMLNSLQSSGGWGAVLASGEVQAGDALDFQKGVERLRQMRPEQILQAGRKHLIPENRSTVTVSPRTSKP